MSYQDERRGREEVLCALKLWAEQRLDDEVTHRPDQNVFKRCLTTTWTQVIDKLDAMLVDLRKNDPKVPQSECTHPGNEHLFKPCTICGASIDWSGG